MDDFAIYMFRSSACLALLYLIYKVAFGRVNRPTLRRWVLLVSALVALVMPLVHIELTRKVYIQDTGQAHGLDEASAAIQELSNNQTIIVQDTSDGTSTPLHSEENAGFDISTFVWIVYFAGIIAVLTVSTVSIISLSRIKAHRQNIPCPGNVKLYVSEDPICPMSWFDSIWISRQDLESRPILMHEMEHVRRHHSADMLFAGILAALQWFNPFVWLFRRELSAVHEYEVDRAMIEKNIDVIQYVQLMLQKVTGLKFNMMNGFHHSIIKNRIAMITRKKSPKKVLWYSMYLVPFVCIGPVVFADWKTVPILSENTHADYAVPQSADSTLPDRTFSISDSEAYRGEYAFIELPKAGDNISVPPVITVVHGQYKPGRASTETCRLDNLVETLAATDSMSNIAIFCYPETLMGVLADATQILRNSFPSCRLVIQRNMQRQYTRLFRDDVSAIDMENLAPMRVSETGVEVPDIGNNALIIKCNQNNHFFVAIGDSQLVSASTQEVKSFISKHLESMNPGEMSAVMYQCNGGTSFGPVDEVITWLCNTAPEKYPAMQGVKIFQAKMKRAAY